MSTDPPLLFAATRPGLTQLLDRISATLSPEARAELEAHETRAERRLSEVFADLHVLWRLKGNDTLYARASDVAQMLGVDPSVISHRLERREREFGPEDVRRGVTDKDVERAILYASQDCLTRSPRGVMMLSLRAVRRLMMTCTEERGVRFRDSLDALVEEAAQLERIAIGLLLADRERGTGLPAPTQTEPLVLRQLEVQLAAMELWREHVARGKRVSRSLQRLALAGVETSVSIPSPALLLPAPSAPQPPFTFRGLRALAAAIGCSWQRARQRLQVAGMWEDTHWHQLGEQTVARAGRLQTERVHLFREGIATELLHRERQGSLFPKGADEQAEG